MPHLRRRRVYAFLPLVFLLAAGSHASPSGEAVPPPGLGVSPLLVDAAAEVWGIIARSDNPVWPLWNASDTPLLLYLPGQQDVLIGHPHPPEGFVPYDGPLRFPGAAMFVKNGPTLIEADGQNTAMDVAGVRTLVVADPLSNLRQNVAALLEDPRRGRKGARAGAEEPRDGSVRSARADRARGVPRVRGPGGARSRRQRDAASLVSGPVGGQQRRFRTRGRGARRSARGGRRRRVPRGGAALARGARASPFVLAGASARVRGRRRISEGMVTQHGRPGCSRCSRSPLRAPHWNACKGFRGYRDPSRPATRWSRGWSSTCAAR